MFFLLLQLAPDGIRLDPAWLISVITGVGSVAATTIAMLYRGERTAMRERIAWLEGELARRDAREDRLIEQVGRAANATEKSVRFAERTQR